MKIGYLGCGVWGFCLAMLLAARGFKVVSWTTKKELANHINKAKEHPLLPGVTATENLWVATEMQEAVIGADLLVESVTSAGIRPVFEQVKKMGLPDIPIVITSKGIEQNTGLILSDVIVQVLGEEKRRLIGYLSGPSYATEVSKGLPTGVVCAAYDYEVMKKITQTFNTSTFRVYPNNDVVGVAMGGALKNIIAIACGIADGLAFGWSSRAALMTRGLHEIRKLIVARGGKAETVYGLSGMGDLCVTCSSTASRNFRFGKLIAEGVPIEQAKEQIGMVVEGAYSCVSALQLSQKLDVSMPITEMVYKIIYEGMSPKNAVISLMQRTIKEEHL